jgi:TM2 domain-containing membrane protein YozV
MYRECLKNSKGAVPLVVLVILAIAALLGAGTVGFLLGQGVQGFALTIAFTVLGVLFLINAVSILRWIKELKQETRK